MKQERSISKNSIWFLIYNIFNVLFSFFASIYVSNVLTSYNIGIVSEAQNIAQYFAVLCFLGIPAYGIREVAKLKQDKEQRSKLFSELFIINFISVVLFFGLFIGVSFLGPNFQGNQWIYWVSGLLILSNIFNIQWLFEGMENYRLIAIGNIIFKVLSYVALILFIKSDSNLLLYASLLVISVAGNFVFSFIFQFKYAKFTFKGLEFKKHLKPIIALIVINLAIEIYTLVDTTMLGYLSTPHNVAYYAYGNKIFKIFLQILNCFTIVVIPRLTEYYHENKLEDFNKLISRTLRIVLMIGLPIVIGAQFVANDIFTVIYPQEFATSALVFRILSISLVIAPVGYLLGSKVLLVTDNEKKIFIPVLIGAAFNIGLNALFILIFNNQTYTATIEGVATTLGKAEVGASIASVISELIVAIIYVILGRKYFKLENIFNNLFKVIGAAIILTAYLFFLNYVPAIGNIYIRLVVYVIPAIILYFGFLALLKEDDIIQLFKKEKLPD